MVLVQLVFISIPFNTLQLIKLSIKGFKTNVPIFSTIFMKSISDKRLLLRTTLYAV